MLRTLARAGRSRRTAKATAQDCPNSDPLPSSPPTSEPLLASLKQPTRSTRSRKTPSPTSSRSPSSSISHSSQTSRSSSREAKATTQDCSNSESLPSYPPTSEPLFASLKQSTRSTRSRKTPSTTSSPSSSISHSSHPSRSSSQTREDTPREAKATQDCPNLDLPLPPSPPLTSAFLKQSTRSTRSRRTPSPTSSCFPSSSISHSSQPSRSSSQTREDTHCTSTSSINSAQILPSGPFINPKGPAPQTDTLREKSNDQSNNCDSNPQTFHHRESLACDPDFMGDTLRPDRSILRTDAPKEWVHVLNMTLEEIYQGKRFHFRLIRYELSGKKNIVPLDVTVPLGSRDGTKVIVSNIGNERKDGTRQDIVFLVKVLKHKRFSRLRNDLLLEVRLPWVDSLNEKEGEVHVEGIDGKVYTFLVNFCNNGLLSGTTIIPNAGMHHPDGKVRGRIVVRFVLSRLFSFFKETNPQTVIDGRFHRLYRLGIRSKMYSNP
jgi:hypothetical protein